MRRLQLRFLRVLLEPVPSLSCKTHGILDVRGLPSLVVYHFANTGQYDQDKKRAKNHAAIKCQQLAPYKVFVNRAVRVFVGQLQRSKPPHVVLRLQSIFDAAVM